MFTSFIKRRIGRFHDVAARAVVSVIKPIVSQRCRCRRRRRRRGCLSPKAFLREARQPEVRTFPF